MIVATYYDVRSEFPAEMEKRWWDSFGTRGFTPVILDENDARKNPRFNEISGVIDSLPTVNSKRFERACWLRWLAYETVAPAFFVDFDIINFGFSPNTVVCNRPMMSHDARQSGPCSVWATPLGIQYFIEHFRIATDFAHYDWEGTHTSDMLLFLRCFPAHVPMCWEVACPQAMTAPLVHFNNGSLKPEWRYHNRHLAIDDFTQRRKIHDEHAIRATVAG